MSKKYKARILAFFGGAVIALCSYLAYQGLQSTVQSVFTQKAELMFQTEIPTEEKEEKICYLTFDDGPSHNTEKILDILKAYDAKATFFVIGNALNEETRPILERIIEEGHAIGLHANNHVYEKFYAYQGSCLEDFEALYKRLKNDYDIETSLYRFPGGSACYYMKGSVKSYIKEMKNKGFSCYDWNVTGEDSVGSPTIYSIQKNVFNKVFAYNTPIVLLHDSSVADMTVEALPGIMDEVQREGYRFETLEGRKEYIFRSSRE